MSDHAWVDPWRGVRYDPRNPFAAFGGGSEGESAPCPARYKLAPD